MPDHPTPTPETVDAFIQRWTHAGAAERANFPQFALELCELIGAPAPEPTTPDERENAYVFEKSVPLPHGTIGRIDLYKRGCFVLEAKQGSDKVELDAALSAAEEARRKKRKRGVAIRGAPAWDTAMERAREQAQSYARYLPPEEIQGGRPPFLIVMDVGATIELYAEFSRSGGVYAPFPDPSRHRLTLDDLRDPQVRALLRQVWTDPMSLDPSRRSARVTREIARRLALLAKSLERDHSPDAVAGFLMRCLFTMFAEDVGLLPDRSFTDLLTIARADVDAFEPLLGELWSAMQRGGYSVALKARIPHFNGFLFENQTVLPLNADQVQLLIEAAEADWRDVEPAIFGALLERALNPRERHKLGAHYTPRAYVERLVQPAVMDPLRAAWDGVKAAALLLAEQGKTDQALKEVDAFHQRLADLRILDPSCGSGNFLYVTLELLKRLEGEVLNARRDLGGQQRALALEGFTVSPQQFLGIEINPRAAAISELVLWIGYLQWQLRMDAEPAHLPTPIIQSGHTIECRDAVLAWDEIEPLLDENGEPVTHWDGRTTRPHPVTGLEVPDESARVPAYRYINPRPAEWPRADFVVGNPPFIGAARMREALGDGYTEAIRKAYKQVPDSADYVMFWWDKAATLTAGGRLQRFGFITTNSLRQAFNRRVLERHLNAKKPISLLFAVPDHPWVDSADGADVRIAMTVAGPGEQEGRLYTVAHEEPGEDGVARVEFDVKTGKIFANLTVGVDVSGAKRLKANSGLATMGVKLNGSGFIINREEALELGYSSDPAVRNRIRPFVNGRDLAQRSRDALVIDLYGLSEEEAQKTVPTLYQWIYTHVKPQRDQTREKLVHDYWWLHGRSRPEFREATADLPKYIATCRTAKHRIFMFLSSATLPESKVVAIALDDGFTLGVLSSRIHVTWAVATGSFLGVGNDPTYNHTDCFETFPFPDAGQAQQARIRAIAERLDAHRKRQQALHPRLTLTGLYNVLEKLRAGQPLTAREQAIHEQGLVSVLRQLHDELDAAVFDAYGWPPDLDDEAILQRLVDLNAARAAEEAAGRVRWLRPEYQAPDEAQPTQATLMGETEASASLSVIRAPAVPRQWPASLPEQAQAVRAALAAAAEPVDAATLAGLFGRRTQKRMAQISELLEMLAALGQARAVGDGRYVGV